jgi:glycosyltransferase involved in cell wall biosynthesis
VNAGRHKFVFYSAPHSAFKPWDWRAIESGIGGSETSHIELARRLHRRGHVIVNYAPCLEQAVDELGLTWTPAERADWSLTGTWIIYRVPEAADHFGSPEEQQACGQKLWLVCQDVDYPTFTPERAARFDGIAALSHAHATYLQAKRGYPNIGISSNGIASDRMARLTERRRHPRRLIYSSSPDRGLAELLAIFRRLREFVPDAELRIFYGFDNIDIAIERWIARTGRADSHPWKKAKEEILAAARQPGVTWRGRVGQTELWQEFLEAGVWCYPTWFAETSCTSSMEAQALGAIPVTRPWWPLGENVQHGVLLEGDPSDPLVQARYVQQIRALMLDPARQDAIRAEMMPWARAYFDWELVADQLEEWARGAPVAANQADFQRRHAKGRVLNVGCDIDLAGLGGLEGAVNVDLVRSNPVSGQPTRAHVLADARLLAFARQFDTVVLGDILEHFSHPDRVRALRQARECLSNGGRVVITCPDDRRALEEQLKHAPGANGREAYASGVDAFHRPVTYEELERALREAGLKVSLYEQYRTEHYDGHAIVAEAYGHD